MHTVRTCVCREGLHIVPLMELLRASLCPLFFHIDDPYVIMPYIIMHSVELFLTLGAHAQEGYGTCPVCLSVCYHLMVDIIHFYGLTKARTTFLKAFLYFYRVGFRQNLPFKSYGEKTTICK